MPVTGYRPALAILILSLWLSPSAHSSEFGLTFHRDNRTYRWNNFLRYQGTAGSRIQIHTSGNLSKILIKKASGSTGSDRWQDNLDLSAGLDYQLNRWAAIGVNMAGERNSVNRGEITTRTGILTSSLTMTPGRDLFLTGTVGGKLDQKKQSDLDSREEGLSYGLSGSWEPLLSGTRTMLKAAFSGDRLSAGHNSSRILAASVRRPLFRDVHISLSFDDQLEGRTNLFGSADDTVLKRQDRISRALSLAVEMPLPQDHRLQMAISSADRRIEYSLPQGSDTEVAQQNSRKTTQGFSAQLSGRPLGRWTVTGDFSLEQGKNDFGRDINDEDVEEIFLGGSVGAGLSPRDSLEFSGHVARSSFDAPHPENYNDRDSFRSALKLSHTHTFNEAFQLVTAATVNLTHLVYLRSQRSANNNWTKIYALYPSILIRPWRALTLVQSFGISANYTEYDFEDLFTDIRSNIFRQARSTTNLNFCLGEALTSTFIYTYRVEDFGRLVKEDRWVEILSWDKLYQNIEFSVTYPLFSGLLITPNLGYGHRREYEHRQGGRHFTSRLISKRIGLSGRYRLWPDNDMTFAVSRSVDDATNIPQRTYDRLSITLEHIF